MPKNLLALHKLKLYSIYKNHEPRLIRAGLLIAVFLAALNFLSAQEPKEEAAKDVILWYRSNSSGMALELIPSQQAAMRYEYCLSVRSGLLREVPRLILPYYDETFRIELRTLYEAGEEFRRQWIFRDDKNIARLSASGKGALFGWVRPRKAPPGEEEEEEKSSGIIELKNSDGVVTREFQYDEDLAEWDYRYFYREGVLVRAEIRFKAPPPPPVVIEIAEVSAEETEDGDAPPKESPREAPKPVERVFVLAYTDVYRYARSGALRAIDRSVHIGEAGFSRVAFPRIGINVPLGEGFVDKGGAYTSEYFMGVKSPEGVTITFNLDNRNRILGEIWRNENGTVIGELRNNWQGDRLQSVLWKSEDDERLIEYDYDSEGKRTGERNFSKGVLERAVTYRDDGVDVEEIYMGGRVILRALWKNGEKISEERVTPGRARP